MSCCGGKLRKALDKAGNIVEGYALSFIDDLFGLPAEKCEQANNRRKICQQCEFSTWFTKMEYARWLWSNKVKVVKNLDGLAELEPLEIKPYSTGKKLCCSICKCFVPKKARVKEERCPKGKWESR